MKTEISPADFSAKATAVASALGGQFEINELDKTAGYIIGAAPFDIRVALGYHDARLHFDAGLSKKLPDGQTLLARDYTDWNHAAMGREPINSRCSADFHRSFSSIAKQVQRMIDSVMPHWDRLTKAYDERVDLMRRTDSTLQQIKSLMGNLVVDPGHDGGKSFYVKGMAGNISAWGEKIQISGLHTLSLSPERAEKLIRLLIEEFDLQ